MKTISIIIPMYNEQESLPMLYERLIKVLNNIKYEYEILFVNDGSKDKSLDIVKEFGRINNNVAYISLSRNFGKEVAMAAAFDYVIGDAAIIMDADLQHPPELIHEMIKYWEEGYDDIYAKRRIRKGESVIKRYTAKKFYKILGKVSRIPIQEDTGDFRLISRRFIDELKKIRESQRYTKGMFSWVGLKKKEIYFDSEARIAGETKWSYGKLIDLAVEGVTSFTVMPLKISMILGMGIGIVSFVYLSYIIIKTLIFGVDTPGYASIICVILFMGGIQLFSLGIIGEYLGRVFMETKNRPLYVVEEYKGKVKIHEKK